jgi:hypothetical protein
MRSKRSWRSSPAASRHNTGNELDWVGLVLRNLADVTASSRSLDPHRLADGEGVPHTASFLVIEQRVLCMCLRTNVTLVSASKSPVANVTGNI